MIHKSPQHVKISLKLHIVTRNERSREFRFWARMECGRIRGSFFVFVALGELGISRRREAYYTGKNPTKICQQDVFTIGLSTGWTILFTRGRRKVNNLSTNCQK